MRNKWNTLTSWRTWTDGQTDESGHGMHCCCHRHCIVAVIIVTLLQLSSCHCCHCHIVTVSCHVITVSCRVIVVLSSHCCCCRALSQLSHGEHGGAGLRAGTGGSYSITWDAAAIVGEHR